MSRSIFLTILSLLLFSSAAYPQERARKFFRNDFSFGKKNISREFRLSQTVDLLVDNNDNIIAADANLIKVFDNNGRGSKIIGNNNEYSALTDLMIAPSGYITIRTINGHSLLSPGLSFIKKTSFVLSPVYFNIQRELKLHMPLHDRIIALNEQERIFSGEAAGRSREGEVKYSNVLIYDHADTLHLIAEYEIMNKIFTGNRSHTVPLLGEFHWTVLPDRRIVYFHSGYDKVISEEESSYSLNIKRLGYALPTKIEIGYDPVVFADSLIQSPGPGLYQLDISIIEVRDIFKSKLLEARYYPPVKKILNDRNLLFVIHHTLNRDGEPLVDIIDTEKEILIKSVYFPFEPVFIKDNRAYRIKWPDQDIPEIEVYQIEEGLFSY